LLTVASVNCPTVLEKADRGTPRMRKFPSVALGASAPAGMVKTAAAKMDNTNGCACGSAPPAAVPNGFRTPRALKSVRIAPLLPSSLRPPPHRQRRPQLLTLLAVNARSVKSSAPKSPNPQSSSCPNHARSRGLKNEHETDSSHAFDRGFSKDAHRLPERTGALLPAARPQ